MTYTSTAELAPHDYLPDASQPADFNGVYPCQHCPLPRSNRVHDRSRQGAVVDVKAQAAGDRND